MKIKIREYLLIVIYAAISAPFTYIIIALFLGFVSLNNHEEEGNGLFFLNTNGVHLDIILKKEDISEKLREKLFIEEKYQYVSFAWGDENFYLNTPEWKDLTLKTATTAVLQRSPALIHLTKYTIIHNEWTEIKISEDRMSDLNKYIEQSFIFDDQNRVICLYGSGYFENDEFFKAAGSYTMYYTCNTWVNDAFKKCDLKACVWTPFDFPLINKYERSTKDQTP